jgi:hypothetical protein
MAPMKLPASSTAPESVAAGIPVIDEPWPAYDVLVLDAATRQSLASVRSLGRAGLRVAAGERFAECDPRLPVLAFRSRYSARNVMLPSFSAEPAPSRTGSSTSSASTNLSRAARHGRHDRGNDPRRAQLEALG